MIGFTYFIDGLILHDFGQKQNDAVQTNELVTRSVVSGDVQKTAL